MRTYHHKQVMLLLWFSMAVFTLVILLSGCGPVKINGDIQGSVDGTVGGTIGVAVIPTVAALLPFFTAQCETLTPGQQCYNADPTVCANCLASDLISSLGGPTVDPSPSPSPT